MEMKFNEIGNDWCIVAEVQMPEGVSAAEFADIVERMVAELNRALGRNAITVN